jgi:uncharacterized membrane protein
MNTFFKIVLGLIHITTIMFLFMMAGSTGSVIYSILGGALLGPLMTKSYEI